jgi:hypothetical protein
MTGALLLIMAATGSLQLFVVKPAETRVDHLYLSRIYEGYVLSWTSYMVSGTGAQASDHAQFHVRYFETLDQAIAFQKTTFPEFTSQPSLAFQQVPQQISVKAEWRRFVVSWAPSNTEKPVRLSFKTREEAEFFQNHFQHGRYSRSPFGHAILFTR